MRARVKKVWVFCLLSILIAGLNFHQVSADPDAEVQSQIEQEKNELEKLKAKIEAQDKAISIAGAKESSLLKTLQKTETRLKLKERELKIYQWNKTINQKKVARLTQKIGEAEKFQNRQKKILGKRIRAIYKEGSMFPVKVLFSATNFHDLLQRIKYMETVAEYDSSVFREYGNRLKQLEEEKRALLNARAKLEQLEKGTLKKRKEIKNKTQERSAFLQRLKRERTLNLRVRKELLDAATNLTNLVFQLEEKLDRGEGIGLGDKKGRLALPVSGKFLNKFGKKRDKQFDTYIVYNGVNIKAPKGTPVRSIFEGKVLYANELEGYGNLIIVGHGKEYHSLYGHLDEIVTKVGRTIRSGQIIGRSGDTGSLVGETLYFELRHKGKPIEPTSWFQVAKR